MSSEELMNNSSDEKMGSTPTKPSYCRTVHVDATAEQGSRCRLQGSGNPSWRAVKAATGEVKELLNKLRRDEYPTHSEFRVTLEHVLLLLSAEPPPAIPPPNRELPGSDEVSNVSSSRVSSDLEDVKQEEVRAWLETTFTQKDAAAKKSPTSPGKFKSAATLVLYGKYMNRWYQEVSLQSHCPPRVARYFKDKIDCWDFNTIHVEALTSRSPLRYIAFELFRTHEIIKKFEITASCLDNFLVSIENGYHHHDNPYHNSTHASDVVQTLHYFFTNLGISEWFTPLEVLAGLLAAVVHDVEHTGTTNSFHVQSCSNLALLYNDRSVLENHHLYFAFTQLKQDDRNILKALSQDDFRTVRSLVVDMVLATDMSRHFEQLKTLKAALSHPESGLADSLDRGKVLCLMLHCADISHPTKPWEVHSEWTARLVNEFFRQGDMEKELGHQCSPLCDRNTTLIPESQIGFIEFIVTPSFELLNDIVEVTRLSCDSPAVSSVNWCSHLLQNKQKWKEQCKGSARELEEEEEEEQVGHVKTVECLTTSVVKERKLSRVETSKDGSAKVIETVHRTQEERRIEIEH